MKGSELYTECRIYPLCHNIEGEEILLHALHTPQEPNVYSQEKRVNTVRVNLLYVCIFVTSFLSLTYCVWCGTPAATDVQTRAVPERREAKQVDDKSRCCLL